MIDLQLTRLDDRYILFDNTIWLIKNMKKSKIARKTKELISNNYIYMKTVYYIEKEVDYVRIFC